MPSFVTGCRERRDAAHVAHLPCRVDAEGAEKREVVDVDAELNFLVALDDQLRGGLFGEWLVLRAMFVQTDSRVEDDVEVVAFVANALNVPVDIVRGRDRLIDRRPELAQ